MAKQYSLAELFNIFTSNVLSPEIFRPLADELGVSIESLQKLQVGINPDWQSYVFPERDGQGNLIGLMQRLSDGKKVMTKKSKRGLIYEINTEDTEQYEKKKWVRVSKEKPCKLCGKADGCMYPENDYETPSAIVCVHISKNSCKSLSLGYLHILDQQRNKKKFHSLLAQTNFPVLIVEGASDACAGMDLGFTTIGKPAAQAGLNFLVDLVRGQEVIVLGDNDAGAGKEGMEATFQQLVSVCKKVIKVLPPSQFKDLRQWKNQVSLTQTQFLEWVRDNGNSARDSNVLDDDVAHTIAKRWLDTEKMQNGLPTVRCYRSQWIEYRNGHYEDCDREEFRGQIYNFLNDKFFPQTTTKGEIKLVPYKPTRAKVSDIIDALSDWCTITDDPPKWLKDMGHPEPENLIAFQNGILDVNEYVNGRIKLYNPTPAFFSFNILPYDFNEDIHSQLWEDFLKDVFNGNQEKIQLLSQWFGYNCVPDMSQEKLLLCTGRPRSGKGTVLNTLTTLLGSKQCVSTSFQTLCTEFGYQPLLGKLAVLLSDAKIPNQKQAEAALEKILQITGRDPVGIRRMYLSYIPQVYLKCRFTIAMNDLPNIPDQANALEPKLNVLYFENSYVGREDISLKFKLKQEAEQGKLINFALRGLKNLRQTGEFIVPKSSQILLNQLRELTTPVAAFIADCCEFEPSGIPIEQGYYVIIDQLYDAWSKWCELSGRKPGIKEQFGRWFLSACPSAAPTRIRLKGKRHRIYRKVRLAKWVYNEYLGVSK